MTASVNLVWMTDEPLDLSDRSSTRWGEEHWKTVGRLYEDYKALDPDYVTGSYDYYSLFFCSGSSNVAVFEGGERSPTGSYTIESWVKPFSVTSRHTIQSVRDGFWLGLDSRSHAVFSSSVGEVSSSMPLEIGRWSHLAVVYDSDTATGSFFIDLKHSGDFVAPPLSASNSLWSIGSIIGGPSGSESVSSTGNAGSFHGMVGENRVWERKLSWVELSESHSRRLGPEIGLISYAKFNEGPLAAIGSAAIGSGVLDHASQEHGRLNGFSGRVGPMWLPNDNISFRPNKAEAVQDRKVSRMLVIDVPSAFYGRQIVPGSVKITDRAFSGPGFGLTRTLIDDGRGGLFISGSMFDDSSVFVWNMTKLAGGSSYNAGASSVQSLAGDGWVDMVVASATHSCSFGLSESDPDQDFSSIQYGLQVDLASVRAQELGVAKSDWQTITVGDRLRIEREGSAIRYKLNDRTFHTTTGATTNPLFVDTSIFNVGARLGNLMLVDDGAPVKLLWKNVVNVSVTPTTPAEKQAPLFGRYTDRDDYRGVEWNKVGNVFYAEGLIVIRDPSLLDMFSATEATAHPEDLIQLSFRGTSRIPVKTLMCRIDRGELNCSANPTFYRTEEDGQRVRVHPDDEIYVTTLGIYNRDRELVGVARLADPLRVRARDRLNVRLRMDF